MTTRIPVKHLTLEQHFQFTKVLRMLYGVEVATKYFEKNLDEFFGFTIEDLEYLTNRKQKHIVNDN